MTSAFYQAICEVSGKAIVVDSSKRPSRAYALSINDDIDLLLIHLIRDGRGVVWSRAKSFKKDIEAGIPGDIPATPAWRTSLRWVLRNLESEWVVSRTEAHKALRVRYEQFVENPGPILEKIGALVCQDLSQLSNDLVSGKAMKVGHNVGGNRLRMSGHIVLRPKLEWERELPAADKRTFWRIGGWLARRYGYRP